MQTSRADVQQSTQVPQPTGDYVLFDPVKLPAHGRVPVWCPSGYTPQLTLTQSTPGRKSVVFCTRNASTVGTVTPLPPLQSVIATPTADLDVPPLATMPTIQ